jgi:hypothetical protein
MRLPGWTLFFALVLGVLPRFSAAAETSVAELPGVYGLHLSLAAPSRFLSSLDHYLDAALGDTPAGYQPGLLSIAPIFLPPPFNTLDLEREIHVLVASRHLFPKFAGKMEEFLFLLGTDDFARFYKNLGGVDGEVEGLWRVDLGGGREIFTAPLGKNLALMAFAEDTAREGLQALAQATLPTPELGLTVTLTGLQNFLSPEGKAALIAQLEDFLTSPSFSSSLERMSQEAESAGLEGRILEAIARRFSKHLPFIASELLALRGASLRLETLDEDLVFKLDLATRPETLFGEFTQTVAGMPSQIHPLARTVGAEAWELSQTNPVTVFPAWRERLERNALDLAMAVDPFIPNFQADLAPVLANLFDHSGTQLGARYPSGPRFFFYESRQAEVLLENTLALFRLTGRFLDRLFQLAPEGEASILHLSQEVNDGRAGWRLSLDPQAMEELSRHLSRQGGLNDFNQPLLRQLTQISVFMVPSPKGLLLVGGEIASGDVDKLLASLDQEAPSPLVDSPEVKRIMERFSQKQLGFAITNSSSWLSDFLASFNFLPEFNARVDTQNILDKFGNSYVGVGVGAKAEELGISYVIPAAVIQDITNLYFAVIADDQAPEEEEGDDADAEGEYDFEFE